MKKNKCDIKYYVDFCFLIILYQEGLEVTCKEVQASRQEGSTYA